jgi:DNA-binding CsgD family transcriptional regulator
MDEEAGYMSKLDALTETCARIYQILGESGDHITRREIARRCGCHPRTVTRALRDLQALRLIEIHARNGRAPRYEVLDVLAE